MMGGYVFPKKNSLLLIRPLAWGRLSTPKKEPSKHKKETFVASFLGLFFLFELTDEFAHQLLHTLL